MRVQAQNGFSAFIKNASSVVDPFFPDTVTIRNAHPLPRGGISVNFGNGSMAPVNVEFVDNLATALVCSSIGRSSLAGFNKTIKLAEADQYWSTGLRSRQAIAEGQALYNAYFPGECTGASGNLFGQYLQEAARWARELAAVVTTPAFKNQLISRLNAHEPNWNQAVNLILYKLHRLDDSVVAGVLDHWKDIPSVTKEWQDYSYLPNFANNEFLSNVNAVISVKEKKSFSPGHGRGGGDTTFIYGRRAQEFLAGKPTALGLTTGLAPDNLEEHHSSSGCFLAGTPVLLSGGRTKPIETIEAGDEVIAAHGVLSIHSDERVIIELEEDDAIYGINDEPPFFSAAHIFQTAAGWKSLDPVTALKENPTGREVGKLEVGDVVYRVTSVAPFAYESVRIERFPSRTLPRGSYIYGLHLLGERSYHANGFLVAMNYPMITAKRLADGFATLSESERQLLARQLEPVMPLLAKAIGSFVEVPLRRALGGVIGDQ